MSFLGSDAPGKLRRRRIAAATSGGGKKKGIRRRATGVRFAAAGASPVLKGFVSSVGWSRETPREAGDGEVRCGFKRRWRRAYGNVGGAREWFGEDLGSSGTVMARGFGKGIYGDAQARAAAAKQSYSDDSCCLPGNMERSSLGRRNVSGRTMRVRHRDGRDRCRGARGHGHGAAARRQSLQRGGTAPRGR